MALAINARAGRPKNRPLLLNQLRLASHVPVLITRRRPAQFHSCGIMPPHNRKAATFRPSRRNSGTRSTSSAPTVTTRTQPAGGSLVS
jgi:hypothetical protein